MLNPRATVAAYDPPKGRLFRHAEPHARMCTEDLECMAKIGHLSEQTVNLNACDSC
jgi:hypothetical protein